MQYELLKTALAIVSALTATIPLLIKLLEYKEKAIKEKNWRGVLQLVFKLMGEAEKKFTEGADKKQWVLAMVKASAEFVNYNINIDELSQIIDDLCALTKKVNFNELTIDSLVEQTTKTN
jgi:hypothetical protein